jgi:hypothetical protein
MDWILFFKQPNFKIIEMKKVDSDGFIHPTRTVRPNTIIRYVYNLRVLSYFYDGTADFNWPPKFMHKGPPIEQVTRQDGTDITKQVLEFSGPRKNELVPFSFGLFKRKWKVRYKEPFGIKLSLEEFAEDGGNQTVTVKNIFNQYYQVERDKI